ncbi:MAG: hypothetical protein CBD18_04210 [Opitutales bacterium TMED158]|nr:MAG: hypothetical protein CBD18_04210 [Opitutales bacterium TMED158]
MARTKRGFPKQIYVLIAAAIVLGFLLLEVGRQTETEYAARSLMEAELILGIPQIPDLVGWPKPMRDRLRELHEEFQYESRRLEALKGLGTFYFINGFQGQARQCMEALSKIEPGEARWPYFLGLATEDFQNKSIAIEAFRRSAAIDPRYPNTRYRLAHALLASGERVESTALLEGLSEEGGWEAWAAYGLATGYAMEERFEAALEALDRAIASDPSTRSFYVLQEEVALFSGNREARQSARGRYESLPFDREPFDPWTFSLWKECHDAFRLLRFSRELELAGDLARSLDLLERAAAVEPDNEAVEEAALRLRDLFERAQ